ncbi:hypothetical protein [Halomonas sp. HG01]|uniref:hypothetical protein n=1 Tax=Halomonas sp. HG01 TaxID=1609967 RepID=UPI0013792861|nr:hypothetical protein [Halomonas sp. HG01]
MSRPDINGVWDKLSSGIAKIIPPVAYLFILMNRYAWGDKIGHSFNQTAPAKLWFIRIILPVAVSVFFYWGLGDQYSEFGVKLSEMVKTAYPSVLGFAIGLYAIVMASDKFETLKKEDGRKGRALLIAVDMAYPLFVVFTVMIINYVLPDDCFLFWMGVANIYSVFLIYDILAAVYIHSIRD